MSARAPALVLACGNPSRGDDAFGPLLIEALEANAAAPIREGRLECRCEYQFQIENALELSGRRWVVFVDASVDAPAPFAFAPVVAAKEAGVLSHALSPAAVLAVAQRLQGEARFEAYTLAIRGEDFALGAPVSPRGREHLAAALGFLEDWLVKRLSTKPAGVGASPE